MEGKPMARKTVSPPAPVKAPRIINVAAIKSTPREGTLIHFTEAQWKGALKGIPVGKALPKRGSRLLFTPLPDGGGLVQGDCISMPCEICRIRMRFDPETGMLGFECLCRPDPNCPEDPPLPAPSSLCRLVIRVGVGPVIRCVSNGCTLNCRLTVVRQGQRLVIACVCRP
jgi:hypothetical protein